MDSPHRVAVKYDGPERRVTSTDWPQELDRRAASRAERIGRWAMKHAFTFAFLALGWGLMGLIIGTANGSRPVWPAPIVFYFTSGGALLATMHALVKPMKQTRIAAVLGVMAASALRGASYFVQGTDTGLRIAAAVGAYLIVLGLAVIVLAQAFGESISGGHGRWE